MRRRVESGSSGAIGSLPQKKDETILSRSLTRPRPRTLAARFHSACLPPSDLLGRLRVGHSHNSLPFSGHRSRGAKQASTIPVPLTACTVHRRFFFGILVSPRGLMVVIAIRRTPTWDRMHSTFQERTSMADAVSSTS